MSTETSADQTETTQPKQGMMGKMKMKVKKTLNKLKGKKNKKNKKQIDDTQPKDDTSHQAPLADTGHEQEGASKQGKEPVLADAAQSQRHDPLDSRKVDDQTGQGQNQHDLMGKHDGIDGPYSQEKHPVLESPSRQHDVPSQSSGDTLGDRQDPNRQEGSAKHDVLDGVARPQYDPYQKKHAVLEGKHDMHVPVASQDVPVASQDVPVASQRDSQMSGDHEKLQRDLEEQKVELEREKAEKLKLLQEKEVFQHATTNLLQVKGQLVGDMLQLQMDMDKLQTDKMQMEAEKIKREQKQIELQQERAQLQMDKDKLIKEKKILEQPGVVGKLTEKVKTAFGAGQTADQSEQAAEIAELDRTVLGSETRTEKPGMLAQISNKVKGVLGGSSTGPTPAELDAYEASLVKSGLRTDAETHPEVEQQGMLTQLTQKVRGAFGGTGAADTIPTTGTEQGVLSKISTKMSQLVFGTDSAETTSTAPTIVSTDHGIDHTKCSRSLDNIHPTRIDMDIADNRSALPLADMPLTDVPLTGQRTDIPLAERTDIPLAETQGRSKKSPKKSPKKVGRRASKKNISRAKAKTDIPQSS